MGIKNFYHSFRRIFAKSIVNILPSIENYDILVIELNGLFYNAINQLEKQKEKVTHIKIFEHTCNEIVGIIQKYEKFLYKNSSIFIVMDGVAPLMKLRTQRARRLKNVIKKPSNEAFDLNSLSVGTSFLNFMSKYIDWFLRMWIDSEQTNTKTKSFSFYFNNEKNKGEGEIKSIRFIQQFAKKKTSKILLHSMDADWLIASLLLHDYNITIHRQHDYISNQNFISEILRLYSFDKSKESLKDFFLMSLFVGNDYVDSIDKITVETLFKVVFIEYKKLKCHLFHPDKTNINISNFKKLTLMIHIRLFGSTSGGGGSGDDENRNTKSQSLVQLRKSSRTNLSNQQHDYSRIIDYIFNLQNIISMHLSDDFQWGFYYKHSTTPSLISFQALDDTIQINPYCLHDDDIDIDIYYRLLLILPKSSKKLLPHCLSSNMDDNLYEEKIIYDIKSNQVSLVDTKQLQKFQESCKSIFKSHKHELSTDEKRRSLTGKVFLYKFDPNTRKKIKSYYGDLHDNRVKLIHL